MTVSIQQDPAEQLIRLIITAVTLTDEQKDAYINALLEGRVHPELEQNLEAICAREAEAAGQEAAVLREEIALQKELAQSGDAEALANAMPLLEEHERDMRTIVGNYNQACSAIERGLDKGIEGDVKSQEDTEADAIRAMLKKKPGETAA